MFYGWSRPTLRQCWEQLDPLLSWWRLKLKSRRGRQHSMLWWRPKYCHLAWLPRLLQVDWRHATFQLRIAVIRPSELNAFSRKRPQFDAGWLPPSGSSRVWMSTCLTRVWMSTCLIEYVWLTSHHCIASNLRVCQRSVYLAVFLCIFCIAQPKWVWRPPFCGHSVCGWNSFPRKPFTFS